MHFSPSQAVLGLLPALIPSAVGAPASGNNVTIHGMYGTNSTSTTTEATPSLVERSMVPAPSNLACYNKMKDCKYKDVYLESAKKRAKKLCEFQKGKVGKPGWEGAWAWDRNIYWVAYNMKVEWIEDCVAPGDGTQNVLKPGPGVQCLDLVWQSWANCKHNGGRGGTIDFGCLRYSYHVINGEEAGHGYCTNLPFDNSTIGGY